MVYVKLMDKRYLGPQNTFPLTPTKEEQDKSIKKAAGREEEQHEQQRQLPRPTMISETC